MTLDALLKQSMPLIEYFNQYMEDTLEAFALHNLIFNAAGKPVDYAVIWGNKAYRAMPGLDSIIGKTVREHFGDTPDIDRYIARYARVVETGKPEHFEDSFTLGTIPSIFSIHAKKVNETHFTTSIRDVTEQRYQEKLFYSFLHNLPWPAVLLDRNDSIIYVNPSFIQTFKYSTIHTTSPQMHIDQVVSLGLIGKPINECIARNGMSVEANMLSKRVLDGNVIDKETTRYAADGTPLNVRVLAVPGRTGDAVTGIIALYAPIDEQKKYERELLQKNTDMTKLISIISHDLRSPFQGILGLSDIIANDDLTIEEYKSYASDLHLTLTRQYHMLSTLLDWARMEQGSIIAQPELISHNSLNGLVKEVFDVFSPSASEKDINFSYSFTTQKPVYFDKTLLSSILRNLVTNAIKFTPKNGSVDVRIYNDIREQIPYVRFDIRDTGSGISEKIITQIQDSVVPSIAGTDGETGTGLGLSTAYRFAKMNNAHLEFSKVNPEYGTIASLYAPVSQR